MVDVATIVARLMFSPVGCLHVNVLCLAVTLDSRGSERLPWGVGVFGDVGFVHRLVTGRVQPIVYRHQHVRVPIVSTETTTTTTTVAQVAVEAGHRPPLR